MGWNIIGKVIAGKFENDTIDMFEPEKKLRIHDSKKESMFSLYLIKKENVSSYQLISADDTTSQSYSYWKGLLGASLLGPLGLIAGAGGKKTGKKTWLIEIVWNDGQKSLLEINSEKGYKFFLKIMY